MYLAHFSETNIIAKCYLFPLNKQEFGGQGFDLTEEIHAAVTSY